LDAKEKAEREDSVSTWGSVDVDVVGDLKSLYCWCGEERFVCKREESSEPFSGEREEEVYDMDEGDIIDEDNDDVVAAVEDERDDDDDGGTDFGEEIVIEPHPNGNMTFG
jgi:hypothetical protein